MPTTPSTVEHIASYEPPPEVGTVIGGRFELLGCLGTGGMGMVFKAYDQVLDQVVALKFLHAALARDPKLIERFRQEVKLARLITHPAVCRLHDLEEADGRRFLTMEVIDGETLAQRLARGPLPAEEVLRIGRGIAAGLGAAHAQGVLHLDLKPGNVMLDRSGRVVVMDFGLSRPSGPEVEDGRRGPVAGTVLYMAPEQLAGGELDGRTDMYALGLVLYEMVCGHVPLAGEARADTALRRVSESAPDPRAERGDVPERLRKVIRHCLARDRDGRYASVEDVWRDLGGATGANSALGPEVTARPMAGRGGPRRRWLAAAAAAAVVAAAGVPAAVWLRGAARAPAVSAVAVLPPAPVAAADAARAAAEARRARAAQRLVVQELRERGLDAIAAERPAPGQAAVGVRVARAANGVQVELELAIGRHRVGRRGGRATLAEAAGAAAQELAAAVRPAAPGPDAREAARTGAATPAVLAELRLARTAARHQDRDRARRHVARVVAVEPSLPAAHFYLAACEEPFTEASRAHLRRARELSRGRTDLLSRLAAAWAISEVDGNDAGANAALAQLHTEAPDDLEVTYWYAYSLGDIWKVEEANALLERVLEAAPDHVPAMLRLFETRIDHGEIAELLRDAERLTTRAPEQPHAHVFAGRTLLAAGRLGEALDAVGEALELEPNHSAALKYRARTLLYQGDLLNARTVARRLAGGDARRRAEALRTLGLSYLLDGRFAAALRHLEESLEAARDEAYEPIYTHKLIVFTLEDLGDWAAALVAAQRWEQHALKATFWQQVAYARLHQDLHRLRQGLISAPEYRRRVPVYLADLRAKGGVDVAGGQGSKLSATERFATGDFREALAQALKDEVPAMNTQFLIGECHARLGQHAQAVEWFRRVLTRPDEELYPTTLVRARLRLAESLDTLGRREEAARYYAAFLASWGSADRTLPEVDRARTLAERAAGGP
jgi:serine/threonine-protein kinase